MQLEQISKSFGGPHALLGRDASAWRSTTAWPSRAPTAPARPRLLNIVSGREDADAGRVLLAKGARVGYLEQEAIEMDEQPHLRGGHGLAGGGSGSGAAACTSWRPPLGEDPTEQQLAAAGRARDAYEVLGGYTIEAKVRSVLFGLGFKEERPRARLTTRVLRRLADAHRAGEAAHPQPRGAAARRAHEPSGPGEREMAGRVPPRLRGHRGGGQPRPRVHGQHGGPRGRGGQRHR